MAATPIATPSAERTARAGFARSPADVESPARRGRLYIEDVSRPRAMEVGWSQSTATIAFFAAAAMTSETTPACEM